MPLSLLVLALSASAALAEGSWQTLSPPDQGFSIDFPAEPVFRDIVEMQGETIAYFHDYRAIVDDGVFLIEVVRFTPAVRDLRTNAELIEIAIQGVAGDCEASTPRAIETASGPASEVTVRCPDDMTLKARFQVERELLYQVGVAGGSGFILTPDALRFLDSFRLTER